MLLAEITTVNQFLFHWYKKSKRAKFIEKKSELVIEQNKMTRRGDDW